MKYGAGSALLKDDIARSSSCCKVRIRTVSVLRLELAWPRAAETDSAAKSRPESKDLGANMVSTSVPEPLDTANVT